MASDQLMLINALPSRRASLARPAYRLYHPVKSLPFGLAFGKVVAAHRRKPLTILDLKDLDRSPRNLHKALLYLSHLY